MHELTTLREGIKMHRFEEIRELYKSKQLSCTEAAQALGMSERHFYRLRKRYESEGLPGIKDKRLGKVSPHRAADKEV